MSGLDFSYLYEDDLKAAQESLKDAKQRLKRADAAFWQAYGKQIDELVAFARKQGAPWPDWWQSAMEPLGRGARDRVAGALYITPESTEFSDAAMDVEMHEKEVRRLKREIKKAKH